MAERRVERGQVYLKSILKDTRGTTLVSWPQAIVDGQLYWPAPGDPEGQEFSNRVGNVPQEGLDGISVKGPVIDLLAAMRTRLVFLDGDEGVWIEAIKEYSSQERKGLNG